jgi:hypothetical protein
MKYYVEAYDANGGSILGNLDGQSVIHCKNWMKSAIYRRLNNTPKEKLSLHGRVVLYKIVDIYGNVCGLIKK